MAVANPGLQEGWDEWKTEMEEKRRRKWKEMVTRWENMEVDEEGEEEEDDGEEKDMESEEEGEEENEAGGKGKEEEEMEEGKQEEEGEKKVKKKAKVNEEINGMVKEAWDTEEEEEDEEREDAVEREAEVNEEVDEEEEEGVMEAELLETGVEREAMGNEDMVERERGVRETEQLEQEGELEEEINVKVDEEVDVGEVMEVKEAEWVEEENDGKDEQPEQEKTGLYDSIAQDDGTIKEEDNFSDSVESGNEDSDVIGSEDESCHSIKAEETASEKQDRDPEELEDPVEKSRKNESSIPEVQTSNEQKDEEVKEAEWVEEENDGKDEQPEQENMEHYDLRAEFSEHINQSGSEDEHVLQNQDSTAQEDGTIKEEDNFSDSVESDIEDSDLMGSEDESCHSIKTKGTATEKQDRDPEELEDPDVRSRTDENSIPEVWASKEQKDEEDETEKHTDEEETVGESLTTHAEEFQDYQEKDKEEEDDSTDDEEAEHSMYEDVESTDEDVVKIYCKDDYPTDIFRTLTEFRDSSLLTDLNLRTEDGKSFHVHSPVLAAVSSVIWESLSRSNMENDRADERKDDATSVGNRWSVSLGPEVDHTGLRAVVEFAYSGLISCLNKDTIEQIKAAAQALGAPRVLDLCTEEQSTKTGGQKEKERISAAEQMMISLQSIKQLWMDRVGCDVVLEAIGESLHVHRVILAVSSDYFRGMFTSGMKESLQPCVTLPFLLASELEVLISCSYSGALPLTWRCVFEITSTALQLQYQPALSLCLNFLQQEINPHSCLDVASFAEAYEMAQLLEVAEDFVLRQFEKVACTLKFKDLPATQLLKYLNSQSLCVPSELVVFKAVVAWIQAKPKKRLRLAKELMKTINFPLMTFKEFKEVQALNMWLDHSLAELYEAVFEDFCSNETAPQSQCRIYLPKESLVLIGGEQISEDLGSRSISRELWFGNSLRNHTGIKKAMEWRKLGEMPEPERFSHEVAVLKGQLYVFGGKRYYGIGDILNSVYRYDPHQNSWESLAEMQEKRCSFSVVVLDGKMYAIGGHCDPEYIDSVEQYCPTTNSWSFAWSLDLPLSGHMAKVSQGQIFVSGGLNNDYKCLASMFLYHPETGSTYLANMMKPRAHHCMETLGDRLYVAGGITTDKNMTIVDQLDCEVYNPTADSWTAFTSLLVPHVGAGSAVLEGKFYVLGGYSQEDYSDTKMVHRYDPTTQRWENMGKMPGPNNDIRASLLRLPSHFRL